MKALLVLILFTISCKSNKPMTDKPTNSLITHLKMKKNTFQVGEPISVDFFVKNNTSTSFEFCYWQSPLEKEFTANFFEIKYDEKIVPYIGKMIKRRPPTIEDNRMLKPKESSTQTININDGYNLDKPGSYTVRFLGRPINGLPNSEPIQFILNP